ncbi:protein involved in polysaccharide export, contains SLBB domain of the beta-grasp fold [Pedobacter westerhofensis]|uniref:Protein involved in polysaccharide export, contains SLBB domain of the beta-grasp fold n=1 Tax=Pedobacter westerhofensis TaxID=425512 RepID=A0A521C9C8_9SPHI|nr:SLBB domain-containing protein [Pedobacter westerhofensis]SMO56092.1 protein involved in polysaccharide export, contains SLBB domain of the beta-grasp fold [Pedobacter westerhofensis]
MIFKNLLTVFALFSFLCFAQTRAIAQTTDYSNVKADDLTDAQIKTLIQRADALGYTDDQLIQMAQAQGMKASEIEKLRTRVEAIRSQSSTSSGVTGGKAVTTQNGRTYSGDSLKNSASTSKAAVASPVQNAATTINSKIFGAELFANGDLKFEPNMRMATPRGYIIGPDDEVLIDLTGNNEANYRLKVSPDGNISVQYAGLIAVGGLSIEQATSKIRTVLSKTYPALRTGGSQVAVNLGNIRSIKVTIVGNVVKPGSYTMASLATAFNALYACGGPSENGSFRNIQIIRNNKVVSTIDVYDFLLKGVQSKNIRLQDQDVINVPVYQTRVEMTGEVKRPKIFEVLNTESLEDVIYFAGGFSNEAYTARIKVLQKTNRERKISDISADNFKTYSPLNGDTYVVEKILERFANRVEISGAVFRPGQYELEKGLTLKGLISKADGLKEDAFLNRGYISRLNADNTQSLLSFDVQKVISGTETDIPLLREDKVTISSIFDLRDEYKVTIQGAVRAPGTFEFAENMNLESLIQQAGGFKEGATPERIEISRRVKNSDVMSLSAVTAEVFTVNVDPKLQLLGEPFILQPYDIVSVRNSEGFQTQKQVRIEGEVQHPGIYTLSRKDERISDVMKRVGGLTPSAYADGASLKRPGQNYLSEADREDRSKDDKVNLRNLNRLKEQGAKDTTSIDKEIDVLSSDLVGINLKKALEQPMSRNDLILEDGDVIRVPRQLQTVKVIGEVLKPNSMIFVPGRTLKYYISGSGGFSYNAYKKATYVVYPNGSVAANRKFLFFNNFPKVTPGSEIFVPKRAEREKLSLGSLVGLSTALASIAAIIVTLLKN